MIGFILTDFSVTTGDDDRESDDFGGYGGVCGPRLVLKTFLHQICLVVVKIIVKKNNLPFSGNRIAYCNTSYPT